MADIEVWKPIKGFDGYEVSNLGRVRSYRKRNSTKFYDKPKILKPHTSGPSRRRYLTIMLMCEKSRSKHFIHRLVASAFIPNKFNKPQVHHKDNNPFNNTVSNLEWVTNSENQRYRFSNDGECHPNVCRDRNRFRVYFSEGGKRKSKNFKEYKEAADFARNIYK